jgi:hypothetical protein
VRDDDVRSACFAALDVLQATWGVDVPYAALAEGFNFRGRRIPFLNRAYGIYRAAGVQRGPAALSLNSSPKQIRYRDEQTPDGVLYRYQGEGPDNHFKPLASKRAPAGRAARVLRRHAAQLVPADLPHLCRAGRA